MFRDRTSARVDHRGSSRRRARPLCETLEGRTVLSNSNAGAVLGTISGVITNASSQHGVSGVKVELISSKGKVVETIKSGSNGFYSFNVKKLDSYVVKELVPKNYVQTGPTFATNAPSGGFATGAGNASWNYFSTNTDPALGPVGPAFWSTIAPEGNDPFESPINLTGKTINLDSVLSVNYTPAVPTHIINNSHQIQAQYPSTATDNVVVGGTPYNLTNFHYHVTAENTVNGKYYPMEEHFVNTSASGGETVVAVFLKLGAHNSALDPVLNAASASLTKPNSSTKITTPIDFAGLLPTNHQGWFFQGSLTTPPLSQPVNWFVYSTPITLDSAQLGQYEMVAGASGFLPNNRPIQPTDGRILNEIDNQVNFAGGDVTGENFTITRGTSSPPPAKHV
jgi:carbonic anhydrase